MSDQAGTSSLNNNTTNQVNRTQSVPAGRRARVPYHVAQEVREGQPREVLVIPDDEPDTPPGQIAPRIRCFSRTAVRAWIEEARASSDKAEAERELRSLAQRLKESAVAAEKALKEMSAEPASLLRTSAPVQPTAPTYDREEEAAPTPAAYPAPAPPPPFSFLSFPVHVNTAPIELTWTFDSHVDPALIPPSNSDSAPTSDNGKGKFKLPPAPSSAPATASRFPFHHNPSPSPSTRDQYQAGPSGPQSAMRAHQATHRRNSHSLDSALDRIQHRDHDDEQSSNAPKRTSSERRQHSLKAANLPPDQHNRDQEEVQSRGRSADKRGKKHTLDDGSRSAEADPRVPVGRGHEEWETEWTGTTGSAPGALISRRHSCASTLPHFRNSRSNLAPPTRDVHSTMAVASHGPQPGQEVQLLPSTSFSTPLNPGLAHQAPTFNQWGYNYEDVQLHAPYQPAPITPSEQPQLPVHNNTAFAFSQSQAHLQGQTIHPTQTVPSAGYSTSRFEGHLLQVDHPTQHQPQVPLRVDTTVPPTHAHQPRQSIQYSGLMSRPRAASAAGPPSGSALSSTTQISPPQWSESASNAGAEWRFQHMKYQPYPETFTVGTQHHDPNPSYAYTNTTQTRLPPSDSSGLSLETLTAAQLHQIVTWNSGRDAQTHSDYWQPSGEESGLAPPPPSASATSDDYAFYTSNLPSASSSSEALTLHPPPPPYSRAAYPTQTGPMQMSADAAADNGLLQAQQWSVPASLPQTLAHRPDGLPVDAAAAGTHNPAPTSQGSIDSIDLKDPATDKFIDDVLLYRSLAQQDPSA